MSTEDTQVSPDIEQMQESEIEATDSLQSSESESQQAPVTDDAAFEAGFAGEPDISDNAKEKIEKELEFAGFTEGQIKDLLGKAAEIDKIKELQSKAFGSLGSLKQSIDSLKNQQRPEATAVTLTKENFPDLTREFPELAEMIVKGLNGALTGGVATPNPGQFEQIIESQLNSRLQPMQQQFESRVLTAMHPDWKQVAPTPEFAQWKQSLDPEVQQQLDSSWDAEFLGQAITAFKGWKNETAKAQQAKARKLESAITPKGGAKPPTQSENDAFIQGFKEARGVR